MNADVILDLVADLYAQVRNLTAERDAYRAKNEELHGDIAKLQERQN